MRGFGRARWDRRRDGRAVIGARRVHRVEPVGREREGVYVSLAGIALVSWLAVRWTRDPGGRRRPPARSRGYLCGLGYANHMAGMLPVGALGSRCWRFGRARCCAGGSRSLRRGGARGIEPVRDAADSRAFPGDQRGRADRMSHQNRDVVHALEGDPRLIPLQLQPRASTPSPPLEDRQAGFGQQLEMWWLYFKWQWMRDPDIMGRSRSRCSPRRSWCWGSSARTRTPSTDPSFWYFRRSCSR